MYRGISVKCGKLRELTGGGSRGGQERNEGH